MPVRRLPDRTVRSEVKYSLSHPIARPASKPPMIAPARYRGCSTWDTGPRTSSDRTTAPTAVSMAAIHVPRCRAAPRFDRSPTRTNNEPTMLARGRLRRLRGEDDPAPGSLVPAKITAPSTTGATIDPTYDSNRSAPIPATSPTLSPTLSAITAGLRGHPPGSLLPPCRRGLRPRRRPWCRSHRRRGRRARWCLRRGQTPR